MNHLAHFYLAEREQLGFAGTLLGDFVKGRDLNDYAPDVRAAIVLHRAVDSFTDRHAAVRECIGLVLPPRRRFAGILVDLFFDFFLACDWQRYHHASLQGFHETVCADLRRYQGPQPRGFEETSTMLARHAWLPSYASLGGIERAIQGIQYRLQHQSKAAALAGAIEELQRHETAMEDCFSRFMPDLMEYVRAFVHARQEHRVLPARSMSGYPYKK